MHFALRISDSFRQPKSQFRSDLRFVPAAVAATSAALAYGHWRLGDPLAAASDGDANSRTIRIALIQGNSLAEWKYDPSREQQIMDEYISLSEQAVENAKTRGDGRPVDLVVWPETMFRTAIVTFDPGYKLPPEVSRTPEEIASLRAAGSGQPGEAIGNASVGWR